jgi:hypothetical protein
VELARCYPPVSANESIGKESIMPEYRLGDVIDDYCVKCKRIMNHAVVSMLNGEPAKVRCRTCHSDHDYRHEQPPPPKVDARKASLFNEVLSKMGGTPEPVQEEVAADPPAAEGTEEKPKTKPERRARAK